VKLDPGAHVFYAFGFALKSGCDRAVVSWCGEVAHIEARKRLGWVGGDEETNPIDASTPTQVPTSSPT
jgi:hypothetical protein